MNQRERYQWYVLTKDTKFTKFPIVFGKHEAVDGELRWMMSGLHFAPPHHDADQLMRYGKFTHYCEVILPEQPSPTTLEPEQEISLLHKLYDQIFRKMLD